MRAYGVQWGPRAPFVRWRIGSPALKSNLTPHLPPPASKPGTPATWRERIRAPRNVPPLLRMVWNTSPGITSATIVLRLVSAVIPVAQLWVGKLIIDQVVRSISGRTADHHQLCVLVDLVVGLAGGSRDAGVFGRNALCHAGLFHALSLDTGTPGIGLSPHAWGQQPKRERGENLWPGAVPGGSLARPLRPVLSREQ